MPRPDSFRTHARAYMERLRSEGKAERTVEGYGYALTRCWKVLRAYRRPPPPRLLREEDFVRISRELAADPWLLRTLNVCLKAMEAKRDLVFKIPERRKVDWLTPEQANLAMDSALRMGMPYAAIIHLELEMGFRRVSVQRALSEDFERGLVRVRGKGHDYVIRTHPRTAAVLSGLAIWREQIEFFDGTGILIPARATRLHNAVKPYSERGMDGLLKRVSADSGIRFSHHTLRRTFGRLLWKSGTRLEVVSRLLGHSDTRTTMAYLGLNFDDQDEGYRNLAKMLPTEPKGGEAEIVKELLVR